MSTENRARQSIFDVPPLISILAISSENYPVFEAPLQTYNVYSFVFKQLQVFNYKLFQFCFGRFGFATDRQVFYRFG